MNCPSCQSIMVKARATDYGEDYDYCRACKKELKELQRPKKDWAAAYDAQVNAAAHESLEFAREYLAPGTLKYYTVKSGDPKWTITEVSPGSTPICYLEISSREDHQASARSPFCACGVLYRTFTGWHRSVPREPKTP